MDEKRLEQLLFNFVQWDSRTNTEGERNFPEKLQSTLLDIDYFANYPSNIQLLPVSNGRNALLALYEAEGVSDTIVLMSHFDTVSIADFGSLQPYAFYPEQLEKVLWERLEDLSSEVQNDLQSKNYIFGRGTMDMKMGLAIHVALLEKASEEDWPINLLLLTVPDEEVNSDGMRESIPYLLDIQENKQLNWKLFLNSEPSFAQFLNDPSYYIYKGSVGKLMPSSLCYGMETHASEPFNGLNAHFMNAFIVKEMEWNDTFRDKYLGEKSPLPTCLHILDLKEDYSTQTTHHVASFFNVQMLESSADEIYSRFQKVVERAMDECLKQYNKRCKQENLDTIESIRIISYEYLKKYAENKYGKEQVLSWLTSLRTIEDERERAAKMCDILMGNCKELAPTVITFFAPPYYPAVNSSDNNVVKELVHIVKDTMHFHFHKNIIDLHYFRGICDLSYVNYAANDETWSSFANNSPNWGYGYHVPFEEMKQLQAPIMNTGPLGKDAHKMTERLHKHSAFVETPMLLQRVIEYFM